MWFATARKLSANLGLYFPSLPWCLRQEDGELTSRRHFHVLLGGLRQKAVNPSTCFALMHGWEKAGGGMARVRLFDPSLNGVDYVSKCLGMAGADSYESAKFGFNPSGLMLSKGAEKILGRVIREERRHVQRLDKRSCDREVTSVESTVCLPHAVSSRSGEAFASRGELSSSAYSWSKNSWAESSESFYDEIDKRAAQKGEKQCGTGEISHSR